MTVETVDATTTLSRGRRKSIACLSSLSPGKQRQARFSLQENLSSTQYSSSELTNSNHSRSHSLVPSTPASPLHDQETEHENPKPEQERPEIPLSAPVQRHSSENLARLSFQAKFESSRIPDKTLSMPRFALNELRIGKMLGKGGFATVCEVKGIDLISDSLHFSKRFDASGRKMDAEQSDDEEEDRGPFHSSLVAHTSKKGIFDSSSSLFRASVKTDDDVDQTENLNRKFMSEYCHRRDSRRGDARYAIKMLRRDVRENPNLFEMGLVDMATEMRVLASLKHPNIVKLRAVANVSPFNKKYFILLDRLYDTLEQRISKKWKLRDKRYQRWNPVGKIVCSVGKRIDQQREQLWYDRLTACFDLAAGLAHIHEHGILHRDIKPDNIGFDIRDDIKIFDFGLAKEIPHECVRGEDRSEDNLYKFTQMVGSPRYMAPEVALGKPYNESCDTYSFAHLAWYILRLKKPYGNITMDYMHDNVWVDIPHRPPLDKGWSSNLRNMFTRSWNPVVKIRPTMSEVKDIFFNELLDNTDQEETVQSLKQRRDSSRRRSTMIMPSNSSSGDFQRFLENLDKQKWLDSSVPGSNATFSAGRRSSELGLPSLPMSSQSLLISGELDPISASSPATTSDEEEEDGFAISFKEDMDNGFDITPQNGHSTVASGAFT